MFLVATVTPTFAQSDGQAWLAMGKTLMKTDKLGITFYFENRDRENLTQAYGYFFGPTIAYKVKPWLSFGGAVRQIHFKTGDSGFAKIVRPEFEFNLKFKLARRLQYAHRNRYEYFDREGRADTTRLRSRITVSGPMRFGPVRSWYSSNEFFWSLDNHNIERNRLTPFGVSMNLPGRHKQKLKLYYMIESIRRNSMDLHILGSYYSF